MKTSRVVLHNSANKQTNKQSENITSLAGGKQNITLKQLTAYIYDCKSHVSGLSDII